MVQNGDLAAWPKIQWFGCPSDRWRTKHDQLRNDWLASPRMKPICGSEAEKKEDTPRMRPCVLPMGKADGCQLGFPLPGD